MKEKMRVIPYIEMMCLSRTELMVLLRKLAGELA